MCKNVKFDSIKKNVFLVSSGWQGKSLGVRVYLNGKLDYEKYNKKIHHQQQKWRKNNDKLILTYKLIY